MQIEGRMGCGPSGGASQRREERREGTHQHRNGRYGHYCSDRRRKGPLRRAPGRAPDAACRSDDRMPASPRSSILKVDITEQWIYRRIKTAGRSWPQTAPLVCRKALSQPTAPRPRAPCSRPLASGGVIDSRRGRWVGSSWRTVGGFGAEVAAPELISCLAGVAQLVEQLIRNQQVLGSSPSAGSIFSTGVFRTPSSSSWR